MRCLVRTRWWCTAAVSSSDGIGASTESALRSDSTITRAPRSIAVETSRVIAVERLRAAPRRRRRRGTGPCTTCAVEAGELPVVVGVDDPRELVVVEDRERQRELATAVGPGHEQVRLRSDRRRDRRHDLFADGVERRVGDLREQLLEVVEQQPRPLRQHRDRGVGAHRADRLGAGLRHRRHDDLELFVRVAEHLLATEHAVVAEHDVLALGQVGELDHAVAAASRRTGARRRACS